MAALKKWNMFLFTKSNTRDTHTATKSSDICKEILNRFKPEKKQTYILMDQTGVWNELLIKVFLLAAVTAIKIMRQQMLTTASFLKCF